MPQRGCLAHETVPAIVREVGPNPSSFQEVIKWQRVSKANAPLQALIDIAANLENMTICPCPLN